VLIDYNSNNITQQRFVATTHKLVIWPGRVSPFLTMQSQKGGAAQLMYLKKSLALAIIAALAAGLLIGAFQFAVAAGQPSSSAGMLSLREIGKLRPAGFTRQLSDGGKTVAVSFTVVDWLPGDVNMDEEVDVSDAILILRSIVGLVQLDGVQEIIADLDGDGKVDVNDAILLLRMIVGLA